MREFKVFATRILALVFGGGGVVLYLPIRIYIYCCQTPTTMMGGGGGSLWI